MVAARGHLDPNENHTDGAAREVHEELGVTSSSLHPWHLVRAYPLDIETQRIPANLEKAEPEHFHHDSRYLFVLDPRERDGIILDSLELISAKWFDLCDFVAEFDNYEAAMKVKLVMEGPHPNQI